MKSKVRVIGAGLSGCEAAWRLANMNIPVELFECKTIKKNEIQKLNLFAELVCSNSLRSDDLTNAVGVLKREMELLNSLVIWAARTNSIPAGQSLAVDRTKFSEAITNKIKNHPLITILDQEVVDLDPNQVTVIATGPLTTEGFQTTLQNALGFDKFYFYDAVAPIITKDSINFEIAYYKSRYVDESLNQDYINCPMNKEQYENFVENLAVAETIKLHEFENSQKIFEGCMPVEVMAKRGLDTLRYGPLKPKGLNRDGYPKNYAVVQLRQDNAIASLYNIVGFQTNLIWPEQKRIIQLIPGLENANIVRYGVMHKNNYINSPLLLNSTLQCKKFNNWFFAGQITGVEGYVESAASGILAAINCYRFLNRLPLISLPKNTILGSLMYYITNASSTNFQPMKSNFGLVDQLNFSTKNKIDKYNCYAKRAIDLTSDIVNLYKL